LTRSVERVKVKESNRRRGECTEGGGGEKTTRGRIAFRVFPREMSAVIHPDLSDYYQCAVWVILTEALSSFLKHWL